MCTPRYDRSLLRIVVEIIVQRLFHIISLTEVTAVFRVESLGVILHVTCDVYIPAVTFHHDRRACDIGFCQDAYIGASLDIVDVCARMT